MKLCCRCNNSKPVSEFGSNKSRKDGYQPYCKQCRSVYNTHWRMDNPDKVRKSKNSWYERNVDRYRSYNAIRKSNKLKATPGWFETELVANVYKKASEFSMEVDHIVPLKSNLVCGLHCWANLQLLSQDINRSKSNREWPDMP